MSSKSFEEYEVEDFVLDESFINFHYRSNLADEAKWSVWLEQRPDKKELVRQARALIETLSFSLGEAEYAVELNKIKEAITEQASVFSQYLTEPENLFKRVRRKRSLVLACAAFILLLITGALIFIVPNRPSDQFIETTNVKGLPLTLVLSDSTQVTLAPQSTLRYPRHFPSTRRDVYLTGEAEFSVKHNENAPFKVYSGNIVATVLGTVFNFKKIGENTVVVELLKGKLSVHLNSDSSGAAPIILYPKEKVTYSKSTQALFKEKIELRTDLSFEHSNFHDIASALKSTYGITVVLESKKTAWRFTGKFKNATAKEVIENICFVENLTADVKSDTLYIK